MYNASSSPRITNCSFNENLAPDGGNGGGIYNCNYSSPEIIDCTFGGNYVAEFGGGMFNEDNSSPAVINCVFSGNSAWQGGGMHNSNNSSPEIHNCTFSGNEALSGGGIYTGTNSLTTIKDSILWDNWAEVKPEICNDGASTAIVTYSDVKGGWPGEGNIGLDEINDDPLFVTGPMGIYYLSHDGVGEQTVNSPCIDAGSDTAANLGMDDKTTRTDGVPDAEIVDMGYHYEPVAIAKK